jgi:hypothetical protein
MWSDTLLLAERTQLIRLVLWAMTSAVLGTALVTIITLRRLAAPIIRGFAIQTMVWSVLEVMAAVVRWQMLAMRDVSSARRLDHLTWFTVGLDVGIVGVGVTALVVAWSSGRRLDVTGAGLGIIAQGLGLLVLDLTFASTIARLI